MATPKRALKYTISTVHIGVYSSHFYIYMRFALSLYCTVVVVCCYCEYLVHACWCVGLAQYKLQILYLYIAGVLRVLRISLLMNWVLCAFSCFMALERLECGMVWCGVCANILSFFYWEIVCDMKKGKVKSARAYSLLSIHNDFLFLLFCSLSTLISFCRCHSFATVLK